MLEAFALLLCATLFGGMMLYSFGFAALVFRTLPANEAGTMLRAAFPWYYLFVAAGGGLAAITVAPIDGLAAALLGGSALAAVYARQILMPRINRARDDQLAGKASAGARFAWLHGWSVLVNFLQLAAIAYVLTGFLSL
jgi:hypothetical protein